MEDRLPEIAVLENTGMNGESAVAAACAELNTTDVDVPQGDLLEPDATVRIHLQALVGEVSRLEPGRERRFRPLEPRKGAEHPVSLWVIASGWFSPHSRKLVG